MLAHDKRRDMTTEPIKLLPVYINEPTHSYVASDEESQVADVEYTNITLEQNDLSNQDDSECPYIRVGTSQSSTGKRQHL